MSNFKFTEAEAVDIVSAHIELSENPEYSVSRLIDRIEQIINERDEWIRVEDRLPEIGERVYVFSDHGDSTDIYDCEWTVETKRYYKMNNITHWHLNKLPSPPKTTKQ